LYPFHEEFRDELFAAKGRAEAMPRNAWTTGMLALALSLTGCSDSSPFRFGGVRRAQDVAQLPPQPAPALFMNKPPDTAHKTIDPQVKPATLIPDRPQPLAPAEPAPQVMEHPLHVLYQRATQRHAKMDAYIFRLKRREVVGGKKQPEETIRVQLRYNPLSVHLVWLNDKTKGREVIYVQGKYDNKMQILLEPTHLLAVFGRQQSVALDDPMVQSNSRYPATETGLASVIERFGQTIVLTEKDPRNGTMKYLGRVNRPEFKEPVEAVHQTIPAQSDRLLPKGGQRWWFFETATGLPCLIITHDPQGEVEYYCYDNVIWPAPLDDRDFDPKVVWRK
jgi:hypothetical protein